MFIVSAICDWKCCIEAGLDISVCQNQSLVNSPTKDIDNNFIYDLYINDPITRAVVIGGLEPMLQIDEVVDLIGTFRRNGCNDPFVIYTGYNADEIRSSLDRLRDKRVIVKYGRYVPGQKPHYDEVLGINLASDNQYAEKLYTD